MCWHKWLYAGKITGYRWLGGVSGGVMVPVEVRIKECTKCGKKKEV